VISEKQNGMDMEQLCGLLQSVPFINICYVVVG